MKPDPKSLNTRPRHLRTAIARGLAQAAGDAVDPTGGDFDAGIIRGMALLTRGEALGHGLWCDRVMLSQVVDAVNGSAKGIKARFTHPDISGDGLGKYTGRVKNARLDKSGDVVRGDLHFSQAAHQTPDGDLAQYLMTLAVDDPEAFGNSIAFDPDYVAEDKFRAEYSEADKDGYPKFKSPDAANVKNLPHARISELRAVDAVDDPAANPNGLFHRGDEVARDAEQLLSWTLGLSDRRPQLVSLDLDPDRVGGFLARFFARHNLILQKKDGTMPSPKFGQFTSGLAKQLSEDKQDRDDEKERTGEEEGDADEDEGHEKEKEGQGDFAADKSDVTCDAGGADSDAGEDDEELNASGVDGGGHDNEDAEKKEPEEKPGKSMSAKKKPAGPGPAALAKGGELPGGTSSADEGAIEDEKQRTADEVAEGSKKPAKKGSGVESPGSDKEAIGPMGDPSHNVGYSQARHDAKKFVEAFGAQGAVWFAEGKTFDQAQALHSKALAKENAGLKAENAALKEKAYGKRGLAKPLNAGGDTTSVSPELVALNNNLGNSGIARFALGVNEMLSTRNRRN